jgi:hypothetical protein
MLCRYFYAASLYIIASEQQIGDIVLPPPFDRLDHVLTAGILKTNSKTACPSTSYL